MIFFKGMQTIMKELIAKKIMKEPKPANKRN